MAFVDIFNTDNKYKIIYADPAWTYKVWSDAGKGRSAETHYKTMTLEDIKNLPVKNIADKDAMLFLWVTFPLLDKAFEVMKAWGFNYTTCAFNWVKANKSADLTKLNVNKDIRMNLGYYTRCVHPSTLIYVKNKNSNIIEEVPINYLYNNYQNYYIWTNKKWKNINNVVQNKINKKVIIKTTFNTFICSDTHKLVYKFTNYKGHCVEYGTIYDLLERKKKYTNSSVNLIYSKIGIEKENYMHSLLDFELNEELGYFLGLFCAEGSFGGVLTKTGEDNRIQLSLHAKELSKFERIKSYIDGLKINQDRYYNYFVSPKYITQENRLSIYFSSRRVANIIREFIKNKGAANKRLNLPLLYQTSITFRKAFIQGMLDGDGSKSQEKYINLRLCNKGLIEDFHKLCLFSGILNKIDRSVIVEDKRPGWGHRTYEKHCMRYINSKNKNIKFQEDTVDPIEIKDIAIEDSNEIFFDIEVEDEIFIANNIITHNSNSELCLLGEKDDETDIVLLGKKGKTLERKSKAVRQVLITHQREHSRKPTEIYTKIEELFGDLPRIELFARTEQPGWDCWGNEVNKFNGEKINET